MQSLELVAEGTPPGMRAVANRLGVKAPSLYRHISGRDALVNYVRDRMASDANLAAPTGDWRSEIRRVVSTQRESFVKHSALVPLLVATPITTGVVLNIYGRSAQILTRAGFAAREVGLILEILDSFILGSAMEQAAPTDVWKPDEPASPLAQAMNAWPVGTDRVRRAFDTGLDLMLDGLEARLPAVD